MSAMLSRRPRPSVHYRYWLFILVLIIVALVTEKWSSKEDFTAYLSNAATLTSLLLGIVAIFYSFISNDSLSRGLGGITIISQEIGIAREKIGSYLQQAEDANRALASSKDSLDETKELIATELKGLGKLLNEVKEESQGLIQIVDNIPNRLERVESGVGDLTTLIQARQSTDSLSDNSTTDEFAKEFMARITPEINLLIIALVLAAKTKQSFTINELVKVLPGSSSTLLGQLIMISSLSLAKITIARTPDDDSPALHWSNKQLDVKSISSYLLENAEAVYNNNLDPKGLENEENADKYGGMLTRIRELFPI